MFVWWQHAAGKIFYASKEFKTDASGINSHGINYRFIFARWETGKGHTALPTFSGLMNLPPPPMQIKSFNEIEDNFSEVYKQIADIFTKNNAANNFSVSEVLH